MSAILNPKTNELYLLTVLVPTRSACVSPWKNIDDNKNLL